MNRSGNSSVQCLSYIPVAPLSPQDGTAIGFWLLYLHNLYCTTTISLPLLQYSYYIFPISIIQLLYLYTLSKTTPTFLHFIQYRYSIFTLYIIHLIYLYTLFYSTTLGLHFLLKRFSILTLCIKQFTLSIIQLLYQFWTNSQIYFNI